jgi:hypothetical protein
VSMNLLHQTLLRESWENVYEFVTSDSSSIKLSKNVYEFVTSEYTSTKLSECLW